MEKKRKIESYDNVNQNDQLININSNNLLSALDGLIELKYSKAVSENNQSNLFYCIGLCLSLLFVITAFEWKFYDSGQIVSLGEVNSSFENLIDVPPTEQMPLPPPKVVQPKIVEVSDEEEIIEELDIDLDIEMTEEQVIEEQVFEPEDLEIEEEKPDEIFTIVEHQPEPIGGYSAFYEYVGKNLKYPTIALRHNIEGRVYVQFVVEKDGSLTDILIVKGIGGGCDEEAQRIVGNAPKWKPGKQRGMPVRVKMILPIHFQLMNL